MVLLNRPYRSSLIYWFFIIWYISCIIDNITLFRLYNKILRISTILALLWYDNIARRLIFLNRMFCCCSPSRSSSPNGGWKSSYWSGFSLGPPQPNRRLRFCIRFVLGIPLLLLPHIFQNELQNLIFLSPHIACPKYLRFFECSPNQLPLKSTPLSNM